MLQQLKVLLHLNEVLALKVTLVLKGALVHKLLLVLLIHKMLHTPKEPWFKRCT